MVFHSLSDDICDKYSDQIADRRRRAAGWHCACVCKSEHRSLQQQLAPQLRNFLDRERGGLSDFNRLNRQFDLLWLCPDDLFRQLTGALVKIDAKWANGVTPIFFKTM